MVGSTAVCDLCNDMKESTILTRSMDMESTIGMMAESMLESIWKTGDMERECLSGPMEQHMKETSSKVN
jgi:hypothetical protein